MKTNVALVGLAALGAGAYFLFRRDKVPAGARPFTTTGTARQPDILDALGFAQAGVRGQPVQGGFSTRGGTAPQSTADNIRTGIQIAADVSKVLPAIVKGVRSVISYGGNLLGIDDDRVRTPVAGETVVGPGGEFFNSVVTDTGSYFRPTGIFEGFGPVIDSSQDFDIPAATDFDFDSFDSGDDFDSFDSGRFGVGNVV